MATFEDSFLPDLDDSLLADLDELSDSEPELEENDAPKKQEEEEEEDETTFSYDDLDSVFKIQKTQEFSDIMQKVEETLDFDSAFKELVACNNLLVKMDEEFAILHSFFRHNYRLKYPRVQWIAPNAIKYARLFKIIHETDTCYSSMFEIDSLPKDVEEKTVEACDRVLDLNSSKKKVVKFVDMKARSIAPNLSVLVGGKVATKLMVSAGGLSELAEMPPTCNVQRVGNKRKRSFVGSVKGFLMETDIVKNTPPIDQDDACGLLAEKLALAARVDSDRGDSSGAQGRALRDEVLEKMHKLQGRPKRGADSSITTFLERMSKEQSSPQSLELGEDDETQSKYFSKFGTFSKVNKSNLAGDEDYDMF